MSIHKAESAGQAFRVFVGHTSFTLTVDLEGRDEDDFYEWLSSARWVETDNGTTVQTKNILFVEKVEPEIPE